MAHERLLIRMENDGLLVLEKVRESDPMHVAYNMMVHAMDEKQGT
jgi:hypothetical protein